MAPGQGRTVTGRRSWWKPWRRFGSTDHELPCEGRTLARMAEGPVGRDPKGDELLGTRALHLHPLLVYDVVRRLALVGHVEAFELAA